MLINESIVRLIFPIFSLYTGLYKPFQLLSAFVIPNEDHFSRCVSFYLQCYLSPFNGMFDVWSDIFFAHSQLWYHYSPPFYLHNKTVLHSNFFLKVTYDMAYLIAWKRVSTAYNVLLKYLMELLLLFRISYWVWKIIVIKNVWSY